jgi:hypothetical protein
MTVAIGWERGGRATIVHSDGQRVSVDSDAAAAPGTPLTGHVVAGPLEGTPLQIKVRGCRRISQDPACFRIEGRFVNLSAKQRTALLALTGD